jgi:hypothetical protein
VRALASVCILLAALGGCGGDDDADAGAASAPTAERSGNAGAAPQGQPPAEPDQLPRAECPEGLGGCRVASGRIAYVERVDPDGDGDAHFVLVSDQEVTLPGLSVIDVPRDLRPHPLPGIGDYLSAAGPVRTGSYGQRQIEAVAVRVARGA